MELKQTNERPTEGQFFAWWEYEGRIWCFTRMSEDGFVYQYNCSRDGWDKLENDAEEGLNVSYFVPIKREKYEVHDANGKYYQSTNSKEEAIAQARQIKGTILRFVEDGTVEQ